MTALQSSPLPLKDRRDRRGGAHLQMGTGWLPVELTPKEADDLGLALHEWAVSAADGSSTPPPPGWQADPRKLGRWRRSERLTMVALVVGIVVCVGVMGAVAVSRTTSTTLTFSFTVSGPSATIWNVTPCRTTPLVITGGGESWDCSVVLWNVDLINNSIQGVSVSNGLLETPNALPYVVLPLNFVPFTIAGQTPMFGGTQDVQVSIVVGL